MASWTGLYTYLIHEASNFNVFTGMLCRISADDRQAICRLTKIENLLVAALSCGVVVSTSVQEKMSA